ncbi:MAG: DUF3667 domain-containing protein [Pseudomonadota bacterium]|nr:DUF3667 domain-containing protein [Pseudomonadota bacterium]
MHELSAPATPPAHCKNCGALIVGRFCASCSQAADVHVPTTRELIHELLEGLTHSDSRLWRTLTLLWFRPGKLTQEFIVGRRVAYLPPFRLYLILSILFFLIASFVHSKGPVIRWDDGPQAVSSTPAASPVPSPATRCRQISADDVGGHPDLARRIQHTCEVVVRDNGDSLLHLALGTMSKAMFIFLPLVAFLHMLLYWRPRYRYAEHLLFFVHLHAFFFCIAILVVSASNAAQAWPSFTGAAGVLENVLGWTLPIYTLLAMRRVFQRRWLFTLIKGVILFLFYMIVFGLTVGVVFVYAAFQL